MKTHFSNEVLIPEERTEHNQIRLSGVIHAILLHSLEHVLRNSVLEGDRTRLPALPPVGGLVVNHPEPAGKGRYVSERWWEIQEACSQEPIRNGEIEPLDMAEAALVSP